MPLISGGEWEGHIVEKIMETLRKGETHYVDVPGNAELRAELGAYLSSPDISKGGKVLVTAGIQEARFLTLQVLGRATGKIAFPQVMHPGVKDVLAVRDLDHVILEAGSDRRMLVWPGVIKNAVSDGVKVLYIESPSRLTGECYEKAELDEIISLCKKYNVSVVVDSGLLPLLEDPSDSLSCLIEIDDTIFLIGEAWPGCGIDDLNIGYILTSEDMVKRIATQKQVISICTSAPSQNGALAAGRVYKKKHPEIIAAMIKKRGGLEAMLQDMGANILSSPVVSFVVCESSSIVQKKLDAAKLRYLDSSYFGIPGYFQLPVSMEATEG
jgi:aspartate/methionine/tyrosine aminotransferase